MTKPENYQREVPEHVDKTQEEWLELSYDTQYHHCNQSRRDQKADAEAERKREKKDWLAEEKKETGCVNCTESRPECLDMHHVFGVKQGDLSQMAHQDVSWDALKEEREKCVVICANCHRLLHAGLIELPERVK